MTAVNDPINEEGFFPTQRRKLFGARIGRLSERKASAHFLSYLMIIAQSIAVLLVFGHAEVPLLLGGNIAVMAIAVLVLFLLVVNVFAADWALIESVLRLGALARNRQLGAMFEHLAYIVFVLLTEGTTYGVVLIVVETRPMALVNSAPIIPTLGFFFFAMAVLRVVLAGWTIVQLIIVSTTLPVMLSTIMSQGKEIIGAHALRQMAKLDISRVPVAAMVRTYARMDTPPRPIRNWWNGFLVDHAIAKEAEEARRADLMIGGLQDLGIPSIDAHVETTEEPAAPQISAPHYTAEHAMEAVRRDLNLTDYPPSSTGDKPLPPVPPTDGGTPSVASKLARETRETVAASSGAPAIANNVTPLRRKGLGRRPKTDRKTASRANAKAGRRGNAEQRVRSVVASNPGIHFDQVAVKAKVSPSTASKWLAVIDAERASHRAAQ